VVLLALLPLLLLAPTVLAAQATAATPEAAIPPVVWELVRLTETNGEPGAIDDPARYTLQFLSDGQLVAKFDCNQGHGGYTAVDGVLSLTPMATTKAMCPPDSHDTTFQRLLSQATAYQVDPETEHLVLTGDAGVLELQPTSPGLA
jgi:para-nitrobenzyl esterase